MVNLFKDDSLDSAGSSVDAAGRSLQPRRPAGGMLLQHVACDSSNQAPLSPSAAAAAVSLHCRGADCSDVMQQQDISFLSCLDGIDVSTAAAATATTAVAAVMAVPACGGDGSASSGHGNANALPQSFHPAAEATAEAAPEMAAAAGPSGSVAAAAAEVCDEDEEAAVNTKQFTASSNKQLTSKFRGVCWNKKNKRWQAAINSGGKYLYLGSFTNESDAAKQFDRAAIKIRGKKAKLNFPNREYVDADGILLEDIELPKPAAALVKAKCSKSTTSFNQRASSSGGSGDGGGSNSRDSRDSPSKQRRCSSPGHSSQLADGNPSSSQCHIPAFRFGPFGDAQLDAAAAAFPAEHQHQRQRQQQPHQQQEVSGSGMLPQADGSRLLVPLSRSVGSAAAAAAEPYDAAAAAAAAGWRCSSSMQQPQQGNADQAAMTLGQPGWCSTAPGGATAAAAAGGASASDGMSAPAMLKLARSTTVTTSLQVPIGFPQQVLQQPDVWQGMLPPGTTLDFFVPGSSGLGLIGVVFKYTESGQTGCGLWNGHQLQIHGSYLNQPDAKQAAVRLLEWEAQRAAAAAPVAGGAAAGNTAVQGRQDSMVGMPQSQLQHASTQQQHQQHASTQLQQQWRWPQLQEQQSADIAGLVLQGARHSNALITTGLHLPGNNSSGGTNTAGPAQQAQEAAAQASNRHLQRSWSGPAALVASAACLSNSNQQHMQFAEGSSFRGALYSMRSMPLNRSASGGASGWAVPDRTAGSLHLHQQQQQQHKGSAELSGPLRPSLSSRMASCDLSEAFQLARQAAAEHGISDLATTLQRMNRGGVLQQAVDGGDDALQLRAAKRMRYMG